MESLSFEICRPIESHAREILSMRNDPITLKNSFHSRPKTLDEFFPEFLKSYFNDPALCPLFLLVAGKRAGYLRFRRLGYPKTKSTCDISIALNPEFRGKGLSAKVLELAKTHLVRNGIDEIWAEVKVENEISTSAFRRAGFREIQRLEKEVSDIGQRFKIVRFSYELDPSKSFGSKVFIIAEVGSNWRMGGVERDLEMGKRLIEKAVQCGADAVKFQTYKPESVYVPNAGESGYLSKAGIKKDVTDIFRDLQMPDELVVSFAEFSKSVGIEFMSTPFSPREFSVVDPHVNVHKIASYEISHVRLIELAAKSKKPTLMSTGASQEEDIEWAVNTFRENGGGSLCLMQCTAKYPAPFSALNLNVIPWLKRRFDVIPGFSDHSRDPLVGPMTAVALGAKVIEKHFTLSNSLPGPDHAFAIIPSELKKMVKRIREVEDSLGSGLKEVLPDEKELSLYARRGIQAVKNIKPGDILKENVNFSILRPGNQKLGIHPKHISEIEGKKATKEISLGSGIQRGDWK